MSESNSSNGIGLAGATFIVFLTLKLTHTIDWSWWWVTAPLWIPTAALLALAAIGGALIGIGKGIEAVSDKRAEKRRQERLKAASAAGLRRKL